MDKIDTFSFEKNISSYRICKVEVVVRKTFIDKSVIKL